MSRSLAVKYRPAKFKDLTEQDSIVKILQHQIKEDKLANGYLFTGPAGCGKTTSARIFANDINGGVGEVIELDAASKNSVDDIRELCNNAQSKSIMGRYKVFILDEVHVLSNQAWQAMLKTLEEPPRYSIFILCTTNPEKIPMTILSRVQRFNFKKISLDGIIDRLEVIIKKEQDETNGSIQVDAGAVDLIARTSNGGMRDAITLLDKCLSYNSSLDEATVQHVLSSVGTQDKLDLLTALVNGDREIIVTIIHQLDRDGFDLKAFMIEFLEFTLDVFKCCILGSMKYSKISKSFIEQILSYSDNMDNIILIVDKLHSTVAALNYSKYPIVEILASLLLIISDDRWNG